MQEVTLGGSMGQHQGAEGKDKHHPCYPEEYLGHGHVYHEQGLGRGVLAWVHLL